MITKTKFPRFLKRIIFLFALISSSICVYAVDNVYNVKNYGAKGDGKSMDAPGINKAIEEAAANGGGTVLVPAGNYLCGSIHLKSNINLFIDQGATIIAATIAEGGVYDEPEDSDSDNRFQDFGHSHWHNSLIWGENLENVSITGKGRIHGKGLVSNNGRGDKRPNKSIALKRCKNVLLRDFTILQGGWFGILATGVDNFTLDNLMIDTNRDGIDIDCCHYVTMSNCRVNSPNDDGICLKSSFALNQFRATENVTITNCIVSGYNMGTVIDGTYKRTPPSNNFDRGPFGRIKFGTESNGGFKNITISNCVFDYCRGLAIETTDGALIEDISVNNITMRDIVNSPIYVRIGGRMRGPEGTPPGQIKRVNIGNIVVYNADPRQASIISGIPNAYIDDISLHDLRIYTAGGGTLEQSKRDMPEVIKDYPEPERHGITPSYGFYVRHVKNIEMHNIKVMSATPDHRPVFFFDDVKGIQGNYWDIAKPTGEPRITLKNVEDVTMNSVTALKNTILSKTTSSELK